MRDNDTVVGLLPLYPSGTNSTFFTTCCRVAITDVETRCPICKLRVVGWDAQNEHERHRIRWNHAYVDLRN